MKPKSKRKEVPTIEKVVEDGDTLQSLAIRYGCAVSLIYNYSFILNKNVFILDSRFKKIEQHSQR